MSRPAFTLIELLVTISVVAMLASAVTLGSLKALEMARRGVEVQAARTLAAAWNAVAAEEGRFPYGYGGGQGLSDLQGNPLSGPTVERYPWKLVDQLGGDLESLAFNENKHLATGDVDAYALSVSPNLGLNATFVGGHQGGSAPLRWSSRNRANYGNFAVTRPSQVLDAANLIMFASARHSVRGESQIGYFEVHPPRTTRDHWSEWDEGNAASLGFVDLRWDKRAVCAMLDGRVELLDEEQLRDQRFWSNEARRADDPGHILQRR